MKYLSRLLMISGSLLVFSCGGSQQSKPIEKPSDPTVQSFVDVMNQHRISLGCEALIWSPTLAGVAQDHSVDMDENSYLSHTNLAGKSPFERMQDNEIAFSAAAENIALNSEGAMAVFDAWQASPGHKANMDNCTYTHHGVGLFGAYWTHMFMLPSN